jgi:hypothetical protein
MPSEDPTGAAIVWMFVSIILLGILTAATLSTCSASIPSPDKVDIQGMRDTARRLATH